METRLTPLPHAPVPWQRRASDGGPGVPPAETRRSSVPDATRASRAGRRSRRDVHAGRNPRSVAAAVILCRPRGAPWVCVRRPDRVVLCAFFFPSSKHRSRRAPVWKLRAEILASVKPNPVAPPFTPRRAREPPEVPTWRPRNTPVPRSIAWPRVRVPVRPRASKPLRDPIPRGRILLTTRILHHPTIRPRLIPPARPRR